MDIETIKRLHNVLDDITLGNNDLAFTELGKIINEQYLTLTDVGCSYFTTSDIGSKFKVIKSNQCHNFRLGETVTLKCVTMAEDDEYKFESENDYWYLGFTDVEKL